MSDPISFGSNPLVRPELLDADLVVDAAASLARVDRNGNPVPAFGPSFEQLRNQQRAAVGNPVQILVDGVREKSSGELLLKVLEAVKNGSSWLGRAKLIEDALGVFVDVAVAEGRALHDARIRDAKVMVFLTIAGEALAPDFLASALLARQSGRGEALEILSQIDAQPGLRATLSRDIRRGVDEGSAKAEAFGVGNAEELRALLERAAAFSAEQRAGQTLSDAELQQLGFAARFSQDTSFRIGVYARIWAQRPQ